MLAVGPFLWLAEVAQILRERLGPDAAKVPRRKLPDVLVRLAARFDPSLRPSVADLGKRVTYSTENSRRRAGFSPRPIDETIVDCARSLLEHRAPAPASA